MLVYLHIPKNGGMTMKSIFDRELGNRVKYVYSDAVGEFISETKLARIAKSLDSHIKVLFSPNIRPLDAEISRSLNLNYATLIRHPVKRAISLYYEERRATEGANHISQRSFEEYVRERPKYDNAISNWQTYNITKKATFEQARELLEQFLVVGVVGHFDMSLLVMRELGGLSGFKIYYKKQNVSVEKKITMKTLPEKTLEMLLEMNQEDLKLFEYANTRLKKDTQNFPNITGKLKVFQRKNFLYNKSPWVFKFVN